MEGKYIPIVSSPQYICDRIHVEGVRCPSCSLDAEEFEGVVNWLKETGQIKEIVMKKYTVHFDITGVINVDLNAKNPEDALAKALYKARNAFNMDYENYGSKGVNVHLHRDVKAACYYEEGKVDSVDYPMFKEKV